VNNATTTKIYIAGHRGMVGSAIVRRLLQQGIREEQLLLRTHKELDLTSQAAVNTFFQQEQPNEVYLAAAKVAASTPTAPTRQSLSTRT